MTYIRKKYRLSLRKAYIELGRKCNFKCRHCFQGESQDVAITPEVVNALCDNILWIDELHFSGGEPMLYVDELRMILKIFKKRRIRVNYLGITTNMSMQSQEFADVYNEWAAYITRPDESGLAVSIDPFHLEFITRYQIDQNIAFYREKCPSLKPKERIRTFDNTVEKCISLVGRAENWTPEDIMKCHIVSTPVERPEDSFVVKINEKCVGDKDKGEKTNPCGYKCVKNCAFQDHMLGIYHDGSVSYGENVSLERAKKTGFVICNLLTDRLYDSVIEFSKKCEALTYVDRGDHTIWFDQAAIDEYITSERNKANYSAIIGNLDDAEEHLWNAIEQLNAIFTHSDRGGFFKTANESYFEENLQNATQEELDDLESHSITRGLTTPETRQEVRDNYERLYDELDEMREKIEEMQKNNTYGAIR